MRKKLAIIGAIVIAIAVTLILSYYSNGSNAPAANTNTTTKKTLAFDETSLLNRGVTSQQLSNLEQALTQYLNSQNKTSGKVDFNTIYRAPTDPKVSTPFTEITFVVQVDGEPTYKAKMDAFSQSEIRLYLYSLGGDTLLYDSQNVGGSSSQE